MPRTVRKREAILAQSGRAGGFTLVEVLVALVVISIGLLGLASMQATTVRNAYSTYLRSQAVVQANAILDRMRANRDQAVAHGYDITFTEAAPTTTCTSTCSPSNMASADLGAWLGDLASLPNGEGQISTSGDISVVQIRWSDSRQSGDLLTLTMATQL